MQKWYTCKVIEAVGNFRTSIIFQSLAIYFIILRLDILNVSLSIKTNLDAVVEVLLNSHE